jgi:hypothetical protein
MSQPAEKLRHDRTIAQVARQRFAYPGSGHPSWKTYLNEPEHTKGVSAQPDTVYPDIVVADERNVVMQLGEIETEMTMNEAETEQWKKYYSLCSSFYLYVPANLREAAVQLIASRRVQLGGLRLYSYDTQGSLLITNV